MSEPDIYDLVAAQHKSPAQDEKPGTEQNGAEQTAPKWDVPHIQLSAYNTTELPDAECPMPERVLWWSLRDMYARFRAGQISKEQGETEKQAELRTYQRDKAKWDMYVSLTQHQAEMWRDIESKAAAYAKCANRSEEADAFFEAVYGVRPKEIAPLDK